MNKEEIVHYVQLEDGRTVIVESLIKEIELSRNDKTRVEADIEYWQKEAQNKNLFEKENIVLKIDKNNLQSQLDKAKAENENLRATIKNDDIAVNKLCEEIKQLKEQRDKVTKYIKDNVIHNGNGSFLDGSLKDFLKIMGDSNEKTNN